jgi:beta-lactamase superfamily II metal-dependent hydrolase
MFTLDALPARQGDALWITWGDGEPHHLLVDGGPPSTATRVALEERLRGRPVELAVVTHIDADHIVGVLALLERRSLPLQIGDVWFNGWDQLPTDLLGAKQAERLGAAIVRRKLDWNGAFGGHAVAIPDHGPLPVRQLPGGLTLTVLSPSRTELAQLRPVWKEEVEKAGLTPGGAAREERERAADLLGEGPVDPDTLAGAPFTDDTTEPNRSSIVLLVEFGDRSLLLTGDAHSAALARGLGRLARERGVEQITVDVVKVPHHGSRNNLGPDLLAVLGSERWVFSTNGAIYHHPDPMSVARIVTARAAAAKATGRPTRLAFTAATAYTAPWESPRLKVAYRYTTAYPPHPDEPLHVDV